MKNRNDHSLNKSFGNGLQAQDTNNPRDYETNNKFQKGINLEILSKAIDAEMQVPINSFPIDIFPLEIQNLIANANETTGYNTDYFSAGILSICATAIGNSVTLFNGTYTSKPILWMSIIGRTGTGKTHPLIFAKKPIEKRDGDMYGEYQTKVKDYEQAENDKKGKKPKYSKYILKDFTPEKLAETLQFNEKGVLIFQDELMRWINSFDQYNKGGDQQMYLDLFNGNGLTVDRVTKDPIRIDKTNVNILGGMQPEILKGMAQNNRSQDGFLDRFLFVYPENIEPILFTGLDINQNHKDNYKRLINNLLDAPILEIKTNNSNIDIFKHWQHIKAKECFKDHLERSIQAKLETYVWRLALIIEMMQQATESNYNNSLRDESLHKAIKLVEYFRYNALKVHDKILSNNPIENLTEIQKELYQSLPYKFKRAEVISLFESKGFKGGTIGRFLNRKRIYKRVETKGN